MWRCLLNDGTFSRFETIPTTMPAPTTESTNMAFSWQRKTTAKPNTDTMTKHFGLLLAETTTRTTWTINQSKSRDVVSHSKFRWTPVPAPFPLPAPFPCSLRLKACNMTHRDGTTCSEHINGHQTTTASPRRFLTIK